MTKQHPPTGQAKTRPTEWNRIGLMKKEERVEVENPRQIEDDAVENNVENVEKLYQQDL